MKKVLSFLLSFSLAITQVLAEILPSGAQTSIQRADERAVIVDIAPPNERGVSFNEYLRFDTQGATILNNSAVDAISPQGREIKANANFSGEEARFIVNQVNSDAPSTLRGDLEIAGKTADLIIANPNGLIIDGLNVINARSSTFAVAKFDAENGIKFTLPAKISVEGGGLKGGYVNIVANAVNLNASIWADELNIIQPSLDSVNLGGMYSGKIKLVGTKSGLGVNNKGAINAGKIRISADGELVNDGTIKADEIKVRAKETMNKGIIVADDGVFVTDKFINRKIAAFDELSIDSNSFVNASNSILYAKNFAEILANDASNKGQIYAGELALYSQNQNLALAYQKYGENLKEILKSKSDAELMEIVKPKIRGGVGFRNGDEGGVTEVNLPMVVAHADKRNYPNRKPTNYGWTDPYRYGRSMHDIKIMEVWPDGMMWGVGKGGKIKELTPKQKRDNSLNDIKAAFQNKKTKETVNLNNKNYTIDKENTKDALVIKENVSDSEVMEIFKNLTGIDKTPEKRHLLTGKTLYIVETDRGNFMLRDFSSTKLKTGGSPRWTIDVSRQSIGMEGGRYEIKFK